MQHRSHNAATSHHHSQAALLQRLPHALACLTPSRAAPLLTALPQLVHSVSISTQSKAATEMVSNALSGTPSQQQQQQQQQHPHSLTHALWQGLTNVLHHTRTSSSTTTTAAATATAKQAKAHNSTASSTHSASAAPSSTAKQPVSYTSYQLHTPLPVLAPATSAAVSTAITQLWLHMPSLPLLLPGEIALLRQCMSQMSKVGARTLATEALALLCLCRK